MALVKLNNRGVRSVSTFGSISSLGTYTFIKKITASSSATVSFVNGSSDVVLDGTYKEYLFTFKDIHPATDNQHFQFNASSDSGSNYNVTKTTTLFQAEHNEADDSAAVGYKTALDLAQSTAAQCLVQGVNYANDSMCSGYMHLYAPSDTTFVKHFISCMGATMGGGGDFIQPNYVSGYLNTTSAVDAIQFSMASGNIDAGDICLYGIN